MNLRTRRIQKKSRRFWTPSARQDSSLNRRKPEAREIPLDNVAVGTLTNILEAKGSLIKKALGIENLRFEIREDRIAFPWFPELPTPDETRAYTMFISQLCKLSKDLKRASSTETPFANEKYAFRCFLLRLGFIGSEYKTSRNILLRNLSGNSSWKNGAPKKEAAICE